MRVPPASEVRRIVGLSAAFALTIVVLAFVIPVLPPRAGGWAPRPYEGEPVAFLRSQLAEEWAFTPAEVDCVMAQIEERALIDDLLENTEEAQLAMLEVVTECIRSIGGSSSTSEPIPE